MGNSNCTKGLRHNIGEKNCKLWWVLLIIYMEYQNGKMSNINMDLIRFDIDAFKSSLCAYLLLRGTIKSMFY